MEREREREREKKKEKENEINTIFGWREDGRKGNKEREIYGRMRIFLCLVGEKLMK